MALSESMAVVVSALIQSCGQAIGVMATKRHLIKQMFPEWRTTLTVPPHQASFRRVKGGEGGAGGLFVLRLIQDGRDLANQHILWGARLWLLGNIHPASIDGREGFQPCAFM